MRKVDIAEVTQRTGLPASTLRFYEEKGRIRAIGRRGLRRLFDPDILERLALISLGRTAGFSLEEIGQMFNADAWPQLDRSMLPRFRRILRGATSSARSRGRRTR